MTIDQPTSVATTTTQPLTQDKQRRLAAAHLVIGVIAVVVGALATLATVAYILLQASEGELSGSQVFTAIPPVVILVVGIVQIRRGIRLRRS